MGNFVIHGLGLLLLIVDLTMNRVDFQEGVPKWLLVFSISYIGLMVMYSCSFGDLYEGVKWCSNDFPALLMKGLFLYGFFIFIWIALGLLNLAKFKYWAGEDVVG